MRRAFAPVLRTTTLLAVCLTLAGGVDLHLGTEDHGLKHAPFGSHEVFRATELCSDTGERHVEAANRHRLKDCPICLRSLQHRADALSVATTSAPPLVASVGRDALELARFGARFRTPARAPPSA